MSESINNEQNYQEQGTGLWENEEFLEWFNTRPPKIQALIRLCPPDKTYRVHGGSFPGHIYSYDEEDGGGVSMQVNIESPLFPRRVFGLKPEHLTEVYSTNAKR